MKIFFTLVPGFLYCISLVAQQTVTPAGGSATGGGGTVSYTVGQAAYITITGSNGSVTQGVQQPFEISVITALEEVNYISLDFSVYPNPAADYLILKINGDVEGVSKGHLLFLYVHLALPSSSR